MLNRLKNLRKNELGFTQAEFAASIGLSRTQYTLIESGKRTLSDKHIKIICAEHQINEYWLKTGRGDMFFNSIKEAELLATYAKMLPSNRQLLIKLATNILEMQDSLREELQIE